MNNRATDTLGFPLRASRRRAGGVCHGHATRNSPPLKPFLAISVLLAIAPGCRRDVPTAQSPPITLEVVGSKAEARHWAIATRYAPVIFQHVDDAAQDAFTKFTYDGDSYGGNNWDNIYTHPLNSFVYYAVTRTDRHYFVYYFLYYPRDWCQTGYPCDFSSRFSDAHENDLEGILLVVDRDQNRSDPTFPEGRVVLMEAQFHGGYRAYKNGDNCGHGYGYSYAGDFAVRADLLAFRGECIGWAPNQWSGEPQPAIYVEPQGHGVLSTKDPDVPVAFPARTYHYGGWAATPDQSSGGVVSYELK